MDHRIGSVMQSGTFEKVDGKFRADESLSAASLDLCARLNGRFASYRTSSASICFFDTGASPRMMMLEVVLPR